MLTILLVLSTFYSSPSATTTLPHSEGIHAGLVGRELSECAKVAGRYRTTQNILWSCLATIFACTWVAVHPNLPGPWDSGLAKFKRRVVILISALIAPEFVTIWAMRQWIAAQRIAKEFNERDDPKVPRSNDSEELPWYQVVRRTLGGWWSCIKTPVGEWFRGPQQVRTKAWTATHGFFVQMGGFILYNGASPIRVLTFTDLMDLIRRGEVDAPEITEDELNDKSKGDGLTKLVVVLQTTWFMLQCFARWISHLPVTELEVVTFLFCLFNISTYVLWWSKPQNTIVAVPVRLRHADDGDPAVDVEAAGGLLRRGTAKETWMIKMYRQSNEINPLWMTVMVSPFFFLIAGMPRPLFKMTDTDDDDVLSESLRMPMFYADERCPDLLLVATGLVFGALHFIPWSSPFPTEVELWSWRSAAIMITAAPASLITAIPFDPEVNDDSPVWDLVFYSVLPGFLPRLLFPAYIFSRFIILLLALITLRAPPEEAFKNIQWTTLLPHI